MKKQDKYQFENKEEMFLQRFYRYLSLGLPLLMIVFILSGMNTISAGSDEIRAIEIQGNDIIPREKILGVVESQVGDQIDSDLIRQDMESIFELGYFYDVKANYEAYETGLKLIFEVIENPRVKEIRIEGNEEIPTEKLMARISTEENEMINISQLNNDLETLMQYYQDQGYILAEFVDVELEDDGLITIIIDEGRLKEIKITGNEKTEDYVILREMETEEGEVFNYNQVQRDLQRVFNLGFFNDVRPSLERTDPQSTEVSLLLEIEERKTGNLDLGVGYQAGSKDHGWLGYIEVSEENLMGRGQRIGLRWEFGERRTYELSFHEPYLAGSETSFGFNIYERSFSRTDFDEKRRGGHVTFGHPLFEEVRGTLRLKHEQQEKDYGDPALDDKYTIQSATVGLNRDTTFDPFNPREGSRDRFSVELAGGIMGGDYDFTKYDLDLRRYYPAFQQKDSWAFRLKGGMATGDVPEMEYYRIGGVDSIRGYRDFSFQGEEMFIFNSEYRFPIIEHLDGVAFVDIGHAWMSGESVELSDIKSSAGVGVRVHTPIGQLRLDFGIHEDSSRLHLSIGPTF